MALARLLEIAVAAMLSAGCASEQALVTPAATESAAQKAATAARKESYEVLVQFRDKVNEKDKIAVRRSINAQLKERLDSPGGARGLELLSVPKTAVFDTVEKVIASLRRHKVVRFAEPQRTYRVQD